MLGSDGRFYDASFDFDGDGKLNGYEYSVMDDVVFVTNNRFNTDIEDDDIEDMLVLSGLDADELRYMDEDERIEALEDAGLDPDEFDEDW